MVTIREVQPTTNGYDGADKVITLTTCQAGDTIVIGRATTANPFGAAPTSTAGVVTQKAGVTNGFAGRCRIDVYTCPVGTTGTKTVTIPYTDNAGGGAGDTQGHAYVIASGMNTDATSTNAGVDSGTASHVVNTLSPTGAADLLIGFIAAFQTSAAADYWTPPGSMTEGSESYDSGFLGFWSGYEQLVASGATGTRTATAVTTDNRYVSVGITLAPAAVSQAVGTATETDIAIGVGRTKTKAVGTATETDSAISAGRTKTKAVSTATETDTAITVTRTKTKAVGAAAETDSVFGVGRTKVRAVGTATETDTALPASYIRDLELTCGPLELKWRTGPPSLKWTFGSPKVR